MKNNNDNKEIKLNNDIKNTLYQNDNNLFQQHLFEQYKIHAELADRNSNRRIQLSKYYITLVSILIGLLTLLIEKNIVDSTYHLYLLLISSIIGFCIVISWLINIRSYRLLNKEKFNLLSDIEKNLPISFFSLEWKSLNEKKYKQLSIIESAIPIVLGVIFILSISIIICLLILREPNYNIP